jgi:prevent-host-death family protein
MAATTFSSRQFNQETSCAKRAAKDGPVFITDRGEPSHVLLSIEEYRRLEKEPMSLRDALVDNRPEPDFDFEIPELGKETSKGFELD